MDEEKLNKELTALEGMKDVFGENFIEQMILRLKVERKGTEIISNSIQVSDSPDQQPSNWKTVLYLLDGQYYEAGFWELNKSEYCISPCTEKQVLEGLNISKEQLEEFVEQAKSNNKAK